MRVPRSSLAVMTAGLVGTSVILGSTPAGAEASQIHVSGTDGDGLIVHDQPSTSSARVGWVAENAVPARDCAVISEKVGNVRYWFHITYAGMSGYIPSYYDDAHYRDMADLTAKYGIPECGAVASPDTPPAPAQQTVANPRFDRQATADWAKAHAKDSQGSGTLCAWFASNALWAGGLPQTDGWRKSTKSSAYVEDLVQYATKNLSASWQDITSNLTSNAVPDAAIGDLIVYDWGDGDTTFDHVSVVVDIADGQYPNVAEWGQLDFTRHPWYKVTRPGAGYVERGWTYSEMTSGWLQEEHPNMRAYLLHIGGGYIVPRF